MWNVTCLSFKTSIEFFSFPYFSGYFHFAHPRVVSIIFLAMISILLRFSMKYLRRCIETSRLPSILASYLPLSFLGTCSPSTSSLWCKNLSIVISFLVLWYICFWTSLVHFKKSLEYLTRWAAHVFIPFIRYMLCSFPVKNETYLGILEAYTASKIPKYLYDSFSLNVLIFSWFGCSVPFIMFCFTHFITSMANFYMLNKLPIIIIIMSCR